PPSARPELDRVYADDGREADPRVPPFANCDDMKRAAIGLRVHSGWTSLVALTLERNVPRVLARARPHLVKTFTYEFRQPFHTAEKMPLDRARTFIARVESEALSLAQQAIESMQTELRPRGYKLTTVAVLLASGKSLPTLEKILASHALIHTADGELFRTALHQAGKGAGLASFPIKERELLSTAAKALKSTPAKLASQLTA